MGRIARSYHLLVACVRVLRSRKELMLFPVLASISGLAVTAAFVTPAYFVSADEITEHSRVTAGSYVLFAGYYLAASFVTVFFSAALISQADVALRGGDPSVKAGLAAAGRRWHVLLAWSAILATVSFLLRQLSRRFHAIGVALSFVLGAAWEMLTYLALPAMTLEGAGIRKATKRSVELFRRSWGEQAAGELGLGLFGFLVNLAGWAVILGVGFLLGGKITLFVCIGLAVLWTFLVSIVFMTLSVIYETALYRYAADDMVPEAFERVDFAGAFTER